MIECLTAGLIAVLTGCGSLPTIVPDTARPRAQSVPLESARGSLTSQQSKVVIDRLKRGGKETSIFDRHLALEQAIAGSPLVVGNRMILLQDGPATFQAMFAAIRIAKDHINLETHIIEDDEAGKRFADALIEKQSVSVRVNLINSPHDLFKRLTDAEVKVVEYNPINPLTAKS